MGEVGGGGGQGDSNYVCPHNSQRELPLHSYLPLDLSSAEAVNGDSDCARKSTWVGRV